jgi:lipopolysaccharide transport system permease protein
MSVSTDQPMDALSPAGAPVAPSPGNSSAPASDAAPRTSTVDLPVIDIYPHTGWQVVPVRELWAFRDLLWLMALRDVTVRYKQTALGVLWAIIQPVMTMVVFAAVFGRGAGMGEKIHAIYGRELNYSVFLFAGLMPWTFFSSAVGAISNSLVNNSNMIRKVYFPRLIMPISAVGAPLADYALSFVVLVGLMAWYKVSFTPTLLLMPLLVISTILAALSVGLLLAAFTVTYRDFRFVVPFMLQIWLFLSPVIWPMQMMGEKYQLALSLNPVGGTIEAVRAAILGEAIPYGAWATSMGTATLLLMMSLVYFSRVERRFADVV